MLKYLVAISLTVAFVTIAHAENPFGNTEYRPLTEQQARSVSGRGSPQTLQLIGITAPSQTAATAAGFNGAAPSVPAAPMQLSTPVGATAIPVTSDGKR